MFHFNFRLALYSIAAIYGRAPKYGGQISAVSHVYFESRAIYLQKNTPSFSISRQDINTVIKNRLALQNKLEKLPQIHHKLVIAPEDILYLRTASIRGNTYIAGRYQADKMKFCIYFSPTGPLQAALDLSLMRDHLDTCTWFVNDLIWTYKVQEVLFVEPLRLRLPGVSYVNITYFEIPLAEAMTIRPRDLAILQRVWIPRRLLQERIEQDFLTGRICFRTMRSSFPRRDTYDSSRTVLRSKCFSIGGDKGIADTRGSEQGSGALEYGQSRYILRNELAALEGMNDGVMILLMGSLQLVGIK